jgi:NADH dehydrogenase (ubiquinone) Fe-S protein 4
MSSLRTTASAARLLRSATHARTALLPATRRCKSSSATDSSTSVPTKTEQQKREMSPMATLPRNSPDYNVPIDMATSYVPDEASPPSVHCVQLSNLCSTNYSTFTPVPKQVQNGSEENVLPAGLISGAPIELQARTVR